MPGLRSYFPYVNVWLWATISFTGSGQKNIKKEQVSNYTMMEEVLWQLDNKSDMVPQDVGCLVFFLPDGEDFVTESINGNMAEEPIPCIYAFLVKTICKVWVFNMAAFHYHDKKVHSIKKCKLSTCKVSSQLIYLCLKTLRQPLASTAAAFQLCRPKGVKIMHSSISN